jgi:site-specific DNA recombinase
LGAMASKESADKSRRLRRRCAELAAEGKPHKSGLRPFGYGDDFVTVIPGEAAVIREAAARFVAGATMSGLARDLNERGLWRGKNRPWSHVTLRAVLRSGRISGQREHHGEIVAAAVWPAIITPADTERIRAILDNPSRRQNRRHPHALLKGRVRCGRCGAPMDSEWLRTANPAYRCGLDNEPGGCGQVSISVELLDGLVTEAVLHRLDHPGLPQAVEVEAERHYQVIAASNRVAHQADRVELTRLRAAHHRGELDDDELAADRDVIEHRIAARRARAQRFSRVPSFADYVGHSDRLRETWTGLRVSHRRTLIRALLDHVTVTAGGGRDYDPRRVSYAWRLTIPSGVTDEVEQRP